MKAIDSEARRLSTLGAALRGAWSWLRQVSGDAAYDNYIRFARPIGDCGMSAAPVLSPAEFYLDSLRRRYAGISRCC